MTHEGYDIVIFALARWDGHYSSSAFSLARELSRYTRVFYVDNPFTWKDYLLRKSDQQIQRRKSALRGGVNSIYVPDPQYPGLVIVTPELVYPANWLPPGKMYDWVSRMNDRIVSRVIRKLFIEYSITRYVFINAFNPLYGRFFEWPRPADLSMYYCVDDIRNSEYVSRHGSYLESEAAEMSDITLVTSLELKRQREKEAKSVVYFPNAADVQLFQKAAEVDGERPSELKEIPSGKKIIFYMGNICHRVDYDLLVKIARNEDWFLIMTGPLTADTYRQAGLDRLPNVIFTGKKRLNELPEYLRYADCCIIPFRLIPLTKSIYPLKINEYLSAGKPVVTTDFSEDIRNFESVAYVSSSHEQFIDNIVLALRTDSAEKRSQRIGYSSANSWSARATELIGLINLKIQKHGAGE